MGPQRRLWVLPVALMVSSSLAAVSANSVLPPNPSPGPPGTAHLGNHPAVDGKDGGSDGSGFWSLFSGSKRPPKSLLEAAQEDDVSRVANILSRNNRKAWEVFDTDGNTPLIWAAYKGHLEIVRLLLDADLPVDSPNNEGNTPLIAASFTNQVDAIKLLLEYGADLERTNKNGDTPLIGAVYFGQLEATKFLLSKGANPEATNRDGKSCLELAHMGHHVEISRLLHRHLMETSLGQVKQQHPRTWSVAAVQQWISGQRFSSSGADELMRALVQSGVDGEVLLELKESHFLPSTCEWSGLCNVPFSTAVKFLRRLRALKESSGVLDADAGMFVPATPQYSEQSLSSLFTNYRDAEPAADSHSALGTRISLGTGSGTSAGAGQAAGDHEGTVEDASVPSAARAGLNAGSHSRVQGAASIVADHQTEDGGSGSGRSSSTKSSINSDDHDGVVGSSSSAGGGDGGGDGVGDPTKAKRTGKAKGKSKERRKAKGSGKNKGKQKKGKTSRNAEVKADASVDLNDADVPPSLLP